MKSHQLNWIIVFYFFFALTLHAQNNSSSLVKKADLAYEKGDYPLAQKHYQAYLDSLTELESVDSLVLFEAIELVEDAFIAENNLTGVENFYQKLFPRFKDLESSSPALYISLKGKLASIYASYPDFKHQKQFILDLLKESETLLGEQHEDHIRMVNILGSYYTMVGSLDLAEPLLIKVVKYWQQKAPNSPSYGFSLNNLGLNYLYKGEYEMAAPFLQKALPIVEKEIGRQSEAYTQISNNLAGAYWNMGRYEEAANKLKEVIEILANQIGTTHPKYLESRNALAAVYLKALNYQEAIKIFEDLKHSLDELGQTKSGFYAIVINNLASTYNEIGNYQEALKLFDESMALCFKFYGQEHLEYAITLINKASSLVNLGRYEEALPLFQQSKSIYLKNINERNPKVSLVYNQIALCLLKMGQTEEALVQLTKAFESNTKDLKLKAEIPDLLTQLPKANFLNTIRAVNNFKTLNLVAAELATEEDYLKSLELAMSYLNQLKSQHSFETDKLAVLSAMAELTEAALQKLSTMPKAVDKAFQLIESNKAMLIADALRAKALAAFGDLPDSLILKEQALKKEQAELKKQLIDVQENQLALKLQQALNKNNQEIRNYQEMLKKDYPKYYENQYSNKAISIKDLQKLLTQDDLLVQYYLGQNQLYTLSMDHKGTVLLHKKAIDLKNFEQLVYAYRQSLTNYNQIIKSPKQAYEKYHQNAKKLYDLLIDPLSKDLEGKQRLLIIPDKILGHIPFEALLQEAGPEYHETVYQELSYLIKDFEIVYNYSAQLVLNNELI